MSKQSSSETNSSRYQKTEVEHVARGSIKNAPYNPRIMAPTALRRLREGIRKHGLLGTIIVNKRTMHIVGGHQRLSALDALEKREDYSVGVTMIDVDDAEEKRLNVLLNNEQTQGDWDLAKLEDIIKGMGNTDIELAGFDRLDLEVLFGDDRFGTMFAEPAVTTEPGQLKEAVDGVRNAASEAMREARQKHKDETPVMDETEYYAVVVFRDSEECDAFVRAVGASAEDRYVSWERVADGMGVPRRMDEAADHFERARKARSAATK